MRRACKRTKARCYRDKVVAAIPLANTPVVSYTYRGLCGRKVPTSSKGKVSLAVTLAASLSSKGVSMKYPGKFYDVVDDKGTRILTSIGFCSPGLRDWYKKNGWTVKRYDLYQGKQRKEQHANASGIPGVRVKGHK